jgi:hypothetical protein
MVELLDARILARFGGRFASRDGVSLK